MHTDQDCPIIYLDITAAYPIRHQMNGKKVKLSEDLIDLSNVESPDFTYGWSKLSGEYLASFASRVKRYTFLDLSVDMVKTKI